MHSTARRHPFYCFQYFSIGKRQGAIPPSAAQHHALISRTTQLSPVPQALRTLAHALAAISESTTHLLFCRCFVLPCFLRPTAVWVLGDAYWSYGEAVRPSREPHASLHACLLAVLTNSGA